MIAEELMKNVSVLWEKTYQHPFVQELGQGNLPKEKFQFYLLQDYLYLLDYAKVMAYAVIKADDEETMTYFTKIQSNILATEMSLHRQYMAEFGIKPSNLKALTPALYNRAYAANMLATAQTGDLAQLIATVLPCAWTYSDFAKRLKRDYHHAYALNPYHTWLEKYASDDFAQSAIWLLDKLASLMADKPLSEHQKISHLFKTSLAFEYLFWEMSYHMQLSVERDTTQQEKECQHEQA